MMKKEVKLFVIIFSGLLVFLPFLTVMQPNPSIVETGTEDPLLDRTLDPYEIEIQYQSDWNSEADSGTGTPEDPYIIENRYLNLSTQNKGAIQIFYSGYHFIIRNCIFIGPGLYRGIELWGAQNGTITNCTISGFRYGIEITGISGQYGAYINVTHNRIYANNRDNLVLDGVTSEVHFVRVINNTMEGSLAQRGCIVDDAYNCIFINNTFSNNAGTGISMELAQDNTLINNTSIDNGGWGFLMEDAHFNNFSLNTARGNTLDGFRLWDVLYSHFHQNIADDNDDMGFDLINGSHCTFTNNTVTNNVEHGFLLAYTSYTTIKFNTILGNGWDCIFESTGSHDNTIENNECDETSDGGIPGFQVIFSLFGASTVIFLLVAVKRKRENTWWNKNT